MPPLRQAHVQGFYRPLIIGFLAVAVLAVAGVIYAGSGGTTIRVTPALSSLTTNFTITVGPTVTGELGLVGMIASEPLTTTITTKPTEEGALIPAHATGKVTIINTTTSAQPLAAATRLQHENGVIVRTTTRLDVPAKGQVEATVVADPLGAEGNVPPGRFTIVALRAANQALIYGQSTSTLTGGMIRDSGSLSLEALTAASNAGQEKLLAEFGETTSGKLKALVPVAVSTNPPAEQPAASYEVKVEMKGTTVTYDQAALDKIIRDRLTTVLKDDQEIASIAAPKLKLSSQPTNDSVTLEVTVDGLAQIRADSALLAPGQFVGLDQEAISKKLLGSGLVTAFTVKFNPWWRTTAGDDPATITVQRVIP